MSIIDAQANQVKNTVRSSRAHLNRKDTDSPPGGTIDTGYPFFAVEGWRDAIRIADDRYSHELRLLAFLTCPPIAKRRFDMVRSAYHNGACILS